jgi:putative membrane protein
MNLNTEQSKEDERTALALERTLLATERTFLSWIRTGLTSVGIGLAIARLLIFQTTEATHTARLVGHLLILWGVGIFVCALINYRRNYQKLSLSMPSLRSLTGLTLMTLILIILCSILFWIVMS